MPRRHSRLYLLLCLAASTIHAQVPKPISGFYGDHTLQLVAAPDGSFTGSFYDETVAGQFTCGFLIKSTTPPSKDGVYKIISWWPAKELGEPVDDEVVNGTLRVSANRLTLQLPKDAHGGCWNVNADLNNGQPIDLDRDQAEPTWKALRVVKAKRVPLLHQPTPSAPSRPYIVQGDVVIVTGKQGSWLHIVYNAYSSSKTFTGWVQDSDLLPAT
ncbi:MAG: hypothetical protein WB439_14190 [Acidobacteriaceae bacterium]